jgi:hypothetical protein
MSDGAVGLVSHRLAMAWSPCPRRCELGVTCASYCARTSRRPASPHGAGRNTCAWGVTVGVLGMIYVAMSEALWAWCHGELSVYLEYPK